VLFRSLWLCEKCNRVIIAQLSGTLSEDVSAPAANILPTFEDHNEDEWRTWAVYDLIAEVPPGYVLEKHKLMSGYIQLVFRKKSNKLIIERWGLANVALKKSSLKDWFRDRVDKDLLAYSYSVDETDFDGEAGLSISGRRGGVLEYLKAAKELLALKKPAMYLDGYAWVCEQTNKVFSIQSLHTKDEDISNEVLERVECH
jgi:hypothetical protein